MKKPPITVSATHTGSGDSMVTNIDFSGGMLKDTRLERSPHGRGMRLVFHGEHEFEAWATGFIARITDYQKRKELLSKPAPEVKDEPVKDVVPEPKVEVAPEVDAPEEQETSEEDEGAQDNVPDGDESFDGNYPEAEVGGDDK